MLVKLLQHQEKKNKGIEFLGGKKKELYNHENQVEIVTAKAKNLESLQFYYSTLAIPWRIQKLTLAKNPEAGGVTGKKLQLSKKGDSHTAAVLGILQDF